MSEQVFQVQGLTCGHCANAVTEEVATLAGVSSVHVELVPHGVSTVTVEAAEVLSTDQVTAALREAGDYTLV